MKRVSSKQRKSLAGKPKPIYIRAKPRRTESVRTFSNAQWKWAGAAIVLLALVCRILYLTVTPLHHDEGVNGMFMTRLFRTGFYQYDPSNFFCPSLYYFGLSTTTLNSFFYGQSGLSTFAVRVVPALFGTATVWLLFSLRRHLGAIASLSAAALVVVSPANVYFSRYFIHEVLFIFFTLALVIALFRYSEQGRTRDLMLGAASAALLFATKETSIITFAVLLLSWLCTHAYLRFRRRAVTTPGAAPVLSASRRFQLWAIALLIFVAVSVFLYSSFFSNFPQGVYDSVRTFGFWSKTGANSYQSPWFTYLQWLSQKELPILILGAAGTIVSLYQASSPFAVFIAFWTLGMTSAYSLIPYKTPWLILNLLLPLAIMAGCFLKQWYDVAIIHSSRALRISALVTLAAALVLSAYQAIDLSFFRYDDDRIPYVYAHTRREFLSLVNQVEVLADHNEQGRNLGVVVMSPEYWPLPWYLRDYSRAGYWGRFVQTAEPVIIAEEPQASEVEQKLGALYRRFGSYELRPGVKLILYVRRDQHL